MFFPSVQLRRRWLTGHKYGYEQGDLSWTFCCRDFFVMEYSCLVFPMLIANSASSAYLYLFLLQYLACTLFDIFIKQAVNRSQAGFYRLIVWLIWIFFYFAPCINYLSSLIWYSFFMCRFLQPRVLILTSLILFDRIFYCSSISSPCRWYIFVLILR